MDYNASVLNKEKTMNKTAYQQGVLLALETAGIKTAGDDKAWIPGLAGYLPIPLAGPVAGALTAPEGKGWAGAGGTLLGELLGIPAGAIAGGAGGAGLGALLGLLAKQPGWGAVLGGGIGAVGGGLAGAGLGRAKGYRMAVGPREGEEEQSA
jgi:hypothetical protein